MWEQIRSNQIRTVVLVVVMGALLLTVGYFIGLYFFDSGAVGLVVALIMWAVLNLIGYFQGDSILLTLSKAKKISRDDHPRLFNIVEEMKIASGLDKMPAIYIIDDPALNAFATGRDPDNASVAITTGLLDKLNRDELQGVIAHEISHIKNRDVLLMALTAILLGSIVMLAWYATRMLFFSSMTGGRRSSAWRPFWRSLSTSPYHARGSIWPTPPPPFTPGTRMGWPRLWRSWGPPPDSSRRPTRLRRRCTSSIPSARRAWPPATSRPPTHR